MCEDVAEMLDPGIIKFLKTKCFHHFPLEGDQEDEWKSVLRALMISAKPSNSTRQIMNIVIINIHEKLTLAIHFEYNLKYCCM